MATHSSTLAWRIPWTEEPSDLQSMALPSWTWLEHARPLDCYVAGLGVCARDPCTELPSLKSGLATPSMLVVSDSLWPPWTVAHQPPLSMAFSGGSPYKNQQFNRILGWMGLGCAVHFSPKFEAWSWKEYWLGDSPSFIFILRMMYGSLAHLVEQRFSVTRWWHLNTLRWLHWSDQSGDSCWI